MKFAFLLAFCAASATAACGSAVGKGPVDAQGAPTGEKPASSAAQDLLSPGPGMAELEVSRLLNGPAGGVLVVLKEKGGSGRVVPMVVGDTEGDAIARRLSRQRYVRPLTHDLLEAVLKKAGMRVVRVEVDDLQDGVFLARLYLVDQSGTVSKIDSRPSDGIALALGAEAPIFAAEAVIAEIGEPAADWEESTPNDLSKEPEEGETWPQQL